MNKISTVMIFLILFSFCAGAEKLPKKVVVIGKIVDKNTNKPIKASLMIAGMTAATTDMNGNYSIKLKPGTYKFEAKSKGYISAAREITLEEGKVVRVRFLLLPAPSEGGVSKEQQQIDLTKKRIEEVEGYRIGPEDVLEVYVFGYDEFSRDVTVRADGKVAYPLVGEIDACGLTPDILADSIKTRLSLYLKEPLVSVIVKKEASKIIYILGEVRSPGKYYMGSKELGVMECIGFAGGYTSTAELTKVSVVRGGKIIPVDLSNVLKGNLDENINLKPGDRVYLPGKPGRSLVQIARDVSTILMPIAAVIGIYFALF
ncbi:MAG: polysaccharide biosynthesis/export family protein [bacterium]|nr:polysaccharide biosynthesis/export family protein [bacterium]